MPKTYRLNRRLLAHPDCKCGWVPGATVGYPPLTRGERKLLLDQGYELDTNVHGDEIARAAKGPYFNSSRFELHRALCLRPTRLERVTSAMF